MFIRKSLLAMAFAASCALAALPSTMLFQGNMALGGVAVDGVKTVSVALYDAASGGNLVWSEDYSNVSFSKGYFAVQLGSGGTALPQFNVPLFIALSVEGEAASSRIPLTLAPYAQQAQYAENANKATTAVTATTATTATTAISATTATTADKAKALDPSVNKLLLHGDASGNATIALDSTVGNVFYRAGINLSAKAQSINLSVSAAGNGFGSGAGLTVSREGLSFSGTGIQFSEYGSLVSGSTACTGDLYRMVVLANLGTATRGLYLCDDNGSGSYYWYKL